MKRNTPNVPDKEVHMRRWCNCKNPVLTSGHVAESHKRRWATRRLLQEEAVCNVDTLPREIEKHRNHVIEYHYKRVGPCSGDGGLVGFCVVTGLLHHPMLKALAWKNAVGAMAKR